MGFPSWSGFPSGTVDIDARVKRSYAMPYIQHGHIRSHSFHISISLALSNGLYYILSVSRPSSDIPLPWPSFFSFSYFHSSRPRTQL